MQSEVPRKGRELGGASLSRDQGTIGNDPAYGTTIRTWTSVDVRRRRRGRL